MHEAQAVGVVWIAHKDGETNLANVLTKSLSRPRLHELISYILYWWTVSHNNGISFSSYGWLTIHAHMVCSQNGNASSWDAGDVAKLNLRDWVMHTKLLSPYNSFWFASLCMRRSRSSWGHMLWFPDWRDWINLTCHWDICMLADRPCD